MFMFLINPDDNEGMTFKDFLKAFLIVILIGLFLSGIAFLLVRFC